ncbi:MAG TPA: Na+/H+ antiporter NhaA [Gammaproteobacteria bacterium]|nr:Na+/H+ antiporter NhaA [Gammaproteobacteria bacterium]
MFNIVLRKFIQFEASASIILMLAAILALLTANSRFYSIYETILRTPFSLPFSTFSVSKPLLFWINDCLMVIFFFLIGLEIKREYIIGHLSAPSQRILPALATLGGIIVPALIFTLFNYDNSINMKGWAIPTATDIAFALGALMLIKDIPKSLRAFLLTVAVLDDLGAVLIIALFYAKNLSVISLLAATFILMTMIILNRLKIKKISIYIILSLILLGFVLQSGVHATIAGVLAAFTIPLDKNKTDGENSLVIIEKALHPWVAFGVLPIFAFANSGIPFRNFTFPHLIEPLSIGIIMGLFLGKQLGVFIGTWVPVKLKWGRLPSNISWSQLYGISILCGIGYTMSLFIGTLAFEEGNPEYDYRIKLAILIASLCSFIYGFLILKFSKKIKR